LAEAAAMVGSGSRGRGSEVVLQVVRRINTFCRGACGE
jgi:hypothetical protein